MAMDLNRWTGIGRLGGDPEVKYMPSGEAVANIRIACGWKGKDKEGVEWVPVTFFGRTAEVVGEYLRKGSQVYVEGRFRTRSWEDKSGQKRYMSEIVGERMQMLGGKRDAEHQEPEREPAKAEEPFSDEIPF